MSKKALLVTTVSGFVPQFEMNNVRILQELGYEVHYAANYRNVGYGTDNHRLDGTGIIRHQIDFSRSPFDLTKSLKAYRQLKQLMRGEKFDLIHCHTPVGAALARLAAKPHRKDGCKVIYTAHGFHFYKGAPLSYWLLFYPAERWLARYTDVLITINEEDYERAQRICGRIEKQKKSNKSKKIAVTKQNPTTVVRINGTGIDTTAYRQNTNIDAKRMELGIPSKATLLISIGELNQNKNHMTVIEALHRCESDLFYIICGEGKNREHLNRQIRQYGLEKRVFLLGYRTDTLELLHASDVFVLPSLREGLSHSLQEAMAAGKAVIASDIRGNRELIEQRKGGWLIQPKETGQLAKILDSLGVEDLKRMGQFNQQKIQTYDNRLVDADMRQIYTSLKTGGSNVKRNKRENKSFFEI